MLYSKVKKIPKFWKIFIIAVVAIVFSCCVFLIIFDGNLRAYEIMKQKEADNRTAAIMQREYGEKEYAEREGSYGISRRSSLITAVNNSSDRASDYVKKIVESSPEKVIEAIVASLNENGAASIAEHLVSNAGKYEDPASVSAYIDSLPGAYSYKMISELEYSVFKGTFEAKVALSEGKDSEKGLKTYGITSVSVSLPLKTYTAQAPAGARLTVNGKTVEEEPRLEKQNYSGIIPSSFSIPDTAFYEFDGFIYKPEIKAYLDGTECVYADGGDKAIFLDPVCNKYKSELFERICVLTFAYSDYVAGAIKFDEVSKCLYPGTDFKDNLAHFDTRWYYDFHHIVNTNAKITQLNVISENLVSAHIVFEQSLRSEKDHETKSVKIELDVYVGCGKVPAGKDKSAWLLVYAGS